jgi:starch phosphorylase
MELCSAIRKKYPGDEEKVRRMSIIEGGQVKMAHLAIYGSQKVNGVAKLHSDILRNILFKDFSEMFPDRFVNVTNGVTQRKWLVYCNPLLTNFITKKIGREWITDFPQIAKLASVAEEESSLREFIAIKQENKKRFIEFLKERNPVRDFQGRIQYFTEPLKETALFDVQIKRIHEYKRQLMNALHVLMVYQELQEDFNSRKIARQVVFAGKAAPGYEMAKYVIQLIYCLSRKINRDSRVNEKLRVVFVENYNVSKAEIIIPAADLSQQISTAGMEASGTGNMKLSMNGALTIGTEDGANIEMHAKVGGEHWPFVFGSSSEEIRFLQETHSYRPWDVCAKEPKIAKALEALTSGVFAETEAEHRALSKIACSLLEEQCMGGPDRYFVLQDLMDYYRVQRKVEDLFADPLAWAKECLYNIAGMGAFSTDISIQNYAQNVWGLDPCPVSSSYLQKIRSEYEEHDRCRIL